MIAITLDKQGDTAEVTFEGSRAIIDVTSESGIGGLRALLVAGRWPEETVVRLHLRGLERLEIGYDQYLVATSVSSTSEPAPLPTVYAISKNSEAQAIADAGDEYYPPIQIVPEEGSLARIPLQNGYFEIGLPPNFYTGQPEAFTMQWIDFFR